MSVTVPPKSILLRFPREVRDTIYGLVLTSFCAIRVCHSCDHDDLKHLEAKLEGNIAKWRYGLFLVNKEISMEARLVFYTTNLFSFGNHYKYWKQNMRGLKAFLERVPIERIQQIKNVLIVGTLNDDMWDTFGGKRTRKRHLLHGRIITKKKQSFRNMILERLDVSASKSIRKMIGVYSESLMIRGRPPSQNIFELLLLAKMITKYFKNVQQVQLQIPIIAEQYWSVPLELFESSDNRWAFKETLKILGSHSRFQGRDYKKYDGLHSNFVDVAWFDERVERKVARIIRAQDESMSVEIARQKAAAKRVAANNNDTPEAESPADADSQSGGAAFSKA